MRILRTVTEIFTFINQKRIEGIKSVGLIPTMGALHTGHLSLVDKCLQNNDLTVVSVFVNPTQFNNKEDFDKYPITVDNDIRLLTDIGCDVLFLPSKEEMYPSEPLIKMSFGYLDTILEGEFRPGHFSGVGIVVGKLFNIIKPDTAYFGQKDLQQFLVIKQLVSDLSMPIELKMCDIARDAKGLALSSRNARLSENGLIEAQKLNTLLKSVISEIQEHQDLAKVSELMNRFSENNPSITMEYLKIVDANTLLDLEHYSKSNKKAICVAVFIENIRLIDNMIFC